MRGAHLKRSMPSLLRPVLVLTGLFAVSRIAFFIAGVRFDTSPLDGRETLWQLLDARALRHDLLGSLWNLHSQPPLFNLTAGLVMRLPHALWQPALMVLAFALGLALVLSSFLLGLELLLPRWVAFGIAVLVILDPANVLYENWFFYTYPTAVLMTFGALCLARFARSRSRWWGAGFFAALAAVVLLNSTFQWPWLVLGAGPAIVAFRRQWRQVLAVAAVPALLVAFWYAKDVSVFGTSTTSSWLGLNLARITLEQAPPQEIASLIAQRKLTPIAAVAPFSRTASAYRSVGVAPHRRTGSGVLDEQTKSDGSPNYNNIAYIAISRQYLSDDIRLIEAHPGLYARNVGKAFAVFAVPADQFQFVGGNQAHISGYARAFDLLAMWQPLGTAPLDLTTQAQLGHGPSVAHISFGIVAIFALAVIGTPVVLWWRRRELPVSLTLGFMWMSVVYVVVLTNLVDIGENNRFRFDLGPLPILAAAVVVFAVARRVTGRDYSPPT